MARFKKAVIGVYAIYCNDGNESKCLYVGRGFIKNREYFHLSRLKHNKHSNVKLQEYYNQYGKESLEFRILENCSMKQYQERESYYINELKPLCNKYRASNYRYKTNTYKRKKSKELRSCIFSGQKNPMAKLSNEDIKEIKIMILDNVRLCQIAQIYNISQSHISNIKNGNRQSCVVV